MKKMYSAPPDFNEEFREQLRNLFAWRRDVRRFKTDPLPNDAVRDLLDAACLAPSVGNSQPWRYVIVEDADKRAEVIADFKACNADALASYSGDDATSYAALKLSGLKEAPVHLAVFADHGTPDGKGLGTRTMPEVLDYSVVSAIQTLWLFARAHHIGVGWVSIINPEVICELLEVPNNWRLIAYLCLGYPVEEHEDPELVRLSWQHRRPLEDFLTTR